MITLFQKQEQKPDALLRLWNFQNKTCKFRINSWMYKMLHWHFIFLSSMLTLLPKHIFWEIDRSSFNTLKIHIFVACFSFLQVYISNLYPKINKGWKLPCWCLAWTNFREWEFLSAWAFWWCDSKACGVGRAGPEGGLFTYKPTSSLWRTEPKAWCHSLVHPWPRTEEQSGTQKPSLCLLVGQVFFPGARPPYM